MPKKPVDYSTTHFYKIVCKDLDNPNMYIGHTTNFKERKAKHKRTYNNPNSKKITFQYINLFVIIMVLTILK